MYYILFNIIQILFLYYMYIIIFPKYLYLNLWKYVASSNHLGNIYIIIIYNII